MFFPLHLRDFFQYILTCSYLFLVKRVDLLRLILFSLFPSWMNCFGKEIMSSLAKCSQFHLFSFIYDRLRNSVHSARFKGRFVLTRPQHVYIIIVFDSSCETSLLFSLRLSSLRLSSNLLVFIFII